MSRVRPFVASDSSHCLQAVFRLVVAELTGNDPGPEVADVETGYVAGRGTWQFRALLAMASRGLDVVDHEALDVAGFLRDPRWAIREQFGGAAVAEQIIAETDLAGETAALRMCLEHPNIKFIQSIPGLNDLGNEARRGRLLICNVNLRALECKPGHLGHYVVVEYANEREVRMLDPSPPEGLEVALETKKFTEAWVSPSEMAANYISVGVTGE